MLDYSLVLLVPHSVTEILNQAQTQHLSAARLTKYEISLLTPSNITLKRCTVLNPATLLSQGPKAGEKMAIDDKQLHDMYDSSD